MRLTFQLVSKWITPQTQTPNSHAFMNQELICNLNFHFSILKYMHRTNTHISIILYGRRMFCVFFNNHNVKLWICYKGFMTHHIYLGEHMCVGVFFYNPSSFGCFVLFQCVYFMAERFIETGNIKLMVCCMQNYNIKEYV